MDKALTSNVGRRILFTNIMNNQDKKKKYEFPTFVDFEENVTLDKNSVIDLAIMVEDKVLDTYGKMPEYFAVNDILDKFPELKTKDSDKLGSLSLSQCGGCTANVGLMIDGKF